VTFLDEKNAEINNFSVIPLEGTPVLRGIKKIFEIQYVVDANGSPVLVGKATGSPLEPSVVRKIDFQVHRAPKAHHTDGLLPITPPEAPPEELEEEPPAEEPPIPPVHTRLGRVARPPSRLRDFDLRTN
jgi:hypothetical protein